MTDYVQVIPVHHKIRLYMFLFLSAAVLKYGYLGYTSLAVSVKTFCLQPIVQRGNLFSVIYKVLTYLRSPNWDTRIAAGQAVEAIVKNIPEWKPAPKPKAGEHLCLLIKIFK